MTTVVVVTDGQASKKTISFSDWFENIPRGLILGICSMYSLSLGTYTGNKTTNGKILNFEKHVSRICKLKRSSCLIPSSYGFKFNEG